MRKMSESGKKKKGLRDEIRVDIVLEKRNVGEVIEIEDEREMLMIENEKNKKWSKKLRIGEDEECVEELELKLKKKEEKNMIIEEKGDERRYEE